jgi:MFS family permease
MWWRDTLYLGTAMGRGSAAFHPEDSLATEKRMEQKPPGATDLEKVRRYSWYALAVLVLAYLFNYIDRNILSILSEELKRDVGLADAQIGFLHGTAFAVFYAIFGIPFGRLSDTWVRTRVIAIGLFFWSLMTALSGTATSFGVLALYRIGVGVGEASLGPAAYSLIVDYFPQRLRATALALYSTGIYFGAGIGFFLGGAIVDVWKTRFPGGEGPMGLHAWQAAFLVIGIPGLIMAAWVWSLREPAPDAESGAPKSRPDFLTEFAAVVPPLTLLGLQRAGAGWRELRNNLAFAAVTGAGAWALSATVGQKAQWIALALGLYAFFSWAQRLALRDPETFRCILGNRTLVYSSVGFASISFVTNGIAFWSAPFFQRAHQLTPGQIGIVFLPATVIGGWVGVTTGGLLSDRLKKRTATARVDIGLLTVLLSIPTFLLMLTVRDHTVAFVLYGLVVAVVSLWLGPAAANANELVPAHMRATSSAFYLLGNTFIGFALGPFTVGRLSDALGSSGYSRADALRYALILSMLFWTVSIAFLWRARVRIVRQET